MKTIIQPREYKDIPLPSNPTSVEAWWYRGLSQGWIGKVGDTYVAMDDGQIYRLNTSAPAFVRLYETVLKSQL